VAHSGVQLLNRTKSVAHYFILCFCCLQYLIFSFILNLHLIHGNLNR